jgi:hypothetical protein
MSSFTAPVHQEQEHDWRKVILISVAASLDLVVVQVTTSYAPVQLACSPVQSCGSRTCG